MNAAATTPRLVEASGPFDAKVLFVGEAPGKDESARAHLGPFTGMSGKAVRNVLKYGGLNVSYTSSTDVRFTNVVPFNPGKLDTTTYDRLLLEHWDNISNDLARMKPRVVVACGGLALRRLTGLTNIRAEHGSVIARDEIPERVVVGGQVRETGLPRDCVVIPCLHPAGVMRTKTRAEWLQVKRVLERVCLYAMGMELERDVPVLREIRERDAGELDTALANASTVCLDTEFDPVTKVPFLVGLSTNHNPCLVYSFKPTAAYCALLTKYLGPGSSILKVAHSYVADAEALWNVGVNVWSGWWWDTLLAFATLYPDTSVGLSWDARYYLDNVRNWKSMAHDDPAYNALDVRTTWRIFEHEVEEARAAGLMEVLYNEVFPNAALSWLLERRGMFVDVERQRVEVERNANEAVRLQADVTTKVKGIYESRGLREKRKVADVEVAVSKLAFDPTEICGKHPTYNGARKKKFANDPSCCCRFLYDAVSLLVDRAPLRPFKASNPHDLRWLLYDRKGWGLPKQYNRGSLTANADAVAKLIAGLAKAKSNPRSKWYRKDADEVIDVLRMCKDVAHLEKVNSTFLQPPVDVDGVSHPPYRQWGTGTGRPAGGFDEAVGDKGNGAGSFNALNIPEDCRVIFVPRHTS